MDVGKDTTLGDGDVSEKLVQLFIVADGELEVTRDDTVLLGFAGGVPSRLGDLCGEEPEDGREVKLG